MNLIMSVVYLLMFSASMIFIMKTNMKIKENLSAEIVFFDEFNLTYKITSIILFFAIPLFIIYAAEDKFPSVEAFDFHEMAEDLLAIIAGAFLNSLWMLHAFNSKILIFKEYFILVNFRGKYKKIEFLQLKNSLEYYTKHFGEGYVFISKVAKVKIPEHFSSIEVILKIIRENTR